MTKLQSRRDITSDSGGDQLLQGTRVSYGGRALFRAGVGDTARKDARILLQGVKNSVEESRTRESDYVVWQKQQGEGYYRETLTLPQFSGPGLPVFQAPGGLTAQLPAGDFRREVQKLAGQPGMAYLGALTRRKDVDWRSVKLAHDQWQYQQQGLTPAGAALVAVAVAWAAGPGLGLLGTSTTPAGLMLDAALGSLATQASITLINNRGNLGNTLKELGSSRVARATITAALTAGVLEHIGALNSIKELANSTAWQDQLTVNLVNASGQSLTNAAINGGKLSDALREALRTGLVNQVHGMAASHIKELEKYYVAHKQAHAHGGAGAAVGGRCADGAIGAAVGEMVAELQDKPGATAGEQEWQAYRANTLALSKITAGAITAYAGGNAQTAINSADTAVRNNVLSTTSSTKRDELAEKVLKGDKSLQTAKEFLQLENADKRSDALVAKFNKDPADLSTGERTELASYIRVYAAEMHAQYGEAVTKELITGMLTGQDYLKSAPQTEAQQKAQTIMKTWGYHKSNASIGDPILAFGTGPLANSIKAGVLSNAAIGVSVNTAVQLGGKDPFNYVDAIVAGVTAAATTGKGIGVSAGINMGGAALGSALKGEDPTGAAIGAGAGSLLGGKAGQVTSGAIGQVVDKTTSDIGGAVVGSVISEAVGGAVKEEIDKAGKK
ncbi:DUF637 domain-containing protein [Zobellella sp. DQSA1]|uniref:DUF637 domain-containing protein n=1 Tax=Zobellella sp. DQSA1 TaxID=3342386 RepID=UPI0035C0DE89